MIHPMDLGPRERLTRLLMRLRHFGYLLGALVLVIVWSIQPSVNVALLVLSAGVGIGLNTFLTRRAGIAWGFALDIVGIGLVWWLFGSVPVVYLILAVVAVVAPIVLERRRALTVIGVEASVILVIAAASVISAQRPLPGYYRSGLTWLDRFVEFGLPLLMLIFVGGFMTFVAGILERASTDLAASEKRLRLSFDRAATGMITFDTEGRIVQANSAFSEQIGYDHEQLIGMKWCDLMNPDDREDAEERIACALGDGPTHWKAEDRLVRADGSEFWAAIVMSLIHDESGNPSSCFLQISDISEQKAAEQALSSSEQRYRSLFEGIPVALYRTSPEGKILDANPALVELLEFPDRESMLQMDVHDAYVDPRGRDDMTGKLEVEGQLLGIEEQLRTYDGQEIWVRDSSRVVHDADGDIAYYEGALVDTTFRHKAERALRESEARLRAIFEHAPIGVMATTLDHLIVAANSGLSGMLGRPVEELRGSKIEKLTHSDDQTVDTDLRQQLVSGVIPSYRTTKRYLHADGHPVWVELTMTLVYDAEGEPELLLGLVRDITEQRNAESDRDNMIGILEATTDLVAILDIQGRVKYANSAARDWYGFGDQHELGALDIAELVDESSETSVSDIFSELVVSNMWEGDVNIKTPSGDVVPGSAVVVAHRDDDDRITHVSATFRDLVERVETQRRLEQLVESKDEFVASVSHELRTPLTAVVGLAQELRRSWEMFSTKETTEFIGLIADQATEVADIVEDLLVAARADIGKVTIAPETVDIEDQVSGVLTGLGLAGSKIETEFCMAQAWADPTRVRQIVRNLLTNAIRYGGNEVRITSTEHDGHIELAVSDNGPGISPGLEEKIFEPYGRAHTPGSQPNSVGLGLTVSRHLARLMEGDLTYTRRPQSTFVLTLPVAASAAETSTGVA